MPKIRTLWVTYSSIIIIIILMMVSAISLDICRLVVVLFQSLPKVNNSPWSPEEDSHWTRLTLRGPWRAGTPLHGGSLGPICGDGDSWGPAGTRVGTSSSGAHGRAGWSGAGWRPALPGTAGAGPESPRLGRAGILGPGRAGGARGAPGEAEWSCDGGWCSRGPGFTPR